MLGMEFFDTGSEEIRSLRRMERSVGTFEVA